MMDESRLSWALVLSVLLHGLLLSLLPLMRRAHLEIPPPSQLVDVDVVPMAKPAAVPRPPAPPPPAPAPQAPAVQAPAVPAPPPPAVPVPKKQIVSPSEPGEEKEPANTRFLSDRNNTVKEEMIHHGQPAAGDPDAQQAPPARESAAKESARAKAERPRPARPVPAARPPANEELAALPKLDQLLPPAGDMIREGIVQPHEAAPPAPAQQEASTKRTDLLRHGDPWRTGGVPGASMDFLPTVRDGDITMLNTKAEQFAPFVRRVAIRVFENFWIALRHNVQGSFAGSTQESATIEAIMDRKGQLVAVNVKDRSMSIVLATDRNLQNACQQGFFDRNPPSGAEANDGNIHFIFEARVAISVDPHGRGPMGGALLSAGLL